MAVVDYTRDPNSGTYRFRDDGGREFAFMGPEAEQMAQWVDRTRPADQRTASFDASAPFGSASSVPDVGPPAPPAVASDAGDMSYAPAPPPAISVAPPVAPGAASTGPPRAGSAPAGIIAAGPHPPIVTDGPSSPPVAPGAPAAPEKTPGAQYLESSLAPGLVRVAGRAAYDPEADDARRRAVRTSQVISGALPETPEELDKRIKAEEERKRATDAGLSQFDAAAKEMQAAADEKRAQATHDVLRADADRVTAEQVAAQVASDGATREAALQKERAAADAMKVDPNRIFSEKGTMSSVASSIGVALGAFGASLNHTENYALKIVDAAIQRDIDAQMDEIRRRGASAQNAIADFQRTHGLSLSEAKNEVKAVALRHAGALADFTAARVGGAEAAMRATQMRQTLVDNATRLEADSAAMRKGRLTTQYTMAAPVAATRGGVRYETPAEQKARFDAVRAGAEAGVAINKATGATGDPDAIRAQAEMRHAENDENRNVQDYGKRKSEVEMAGSTLRQYVESMGGSIQKDGRIIWDDRDIPGTGPIDARTPDIQGKHRRVTQSRDWLAANVGKALSGASVSPDQQERIDSLLSAKNEEGARRGAEILMRDIADKGLEIDSSFGADVVKKYTENKGETARIRDDAATRAKEEPY